MRLQNSDNLRRPALINQAQEIDNYLKTLSPTQLTKIMHISNPLAASTHQLIADWTVRPTSLALDSFVGDIYRGLRASQLSTEERDYADKHLFILSGLYGLLRPFDGIQPYRLEMAYKLPSAKFANLYKYWGSVLADALPAKQTIVNVSSVEYSKAILPYIDAKRVVTPEFLTLDRKTDQPKFTAVHAKVARGAFACWMIQHQLQDEEKLQQFNEFGYEYHPGLSKPERPVFVCQEFGGLGLKV